MTLVYRSALQVVAWLGDAGDHTSLALDYIARMQTIDHHSSECHEKLSLLRAGYRGPMHQAMSEASLGSKRDLGKPKNRCCMW